jgi:hypothetical protein
MIFRRADRQCSTSIRRRFYEQNPNKKEVTEEECRDKVDEKDTCGGEVETDSQFAKSEWKQRRRCNHARAMAE